MPKKQFVQGKMPVIAHGIKRSDYGTLTIALGEILSALSTHPLMIDPPSSYLTPTPLFHTYDFMQRTLCKLEEIPIQNLLVNEEDALESWNDCVGRCSMARLIVEDENGKAAELLGGRIDFGEQVRKAVVRAAIISGKAGTAEEGAIRRVDTNVNGKHRGSKSGKKK